MTVIFTVIVTRTPNLTKFYLKHYNQLIPVTETKVNQRKHENREVEMYFWTLFTNRSSPRIVWLDFRHSLLTQIPCPSLQPQTNPPPSLSFFTFSLNCIWPGSAESWLLQGRTPYSVSAVSPVLEKVAASKWSKRPGGRGGPLLMPLGYWEYVTSNHSEASRVHTAVTIYTCTFLSLFHFSRF